MTGVPNNILVPFVSADIDSSLATTGAETLPIQALLIGQKLSGGTMAVDTPVLVTGSDQVGKLAGYGSALHRASIRWFQNNRVSTVYIVAIADGGSATASVQEIQLTGTATASGELSVYVDGDRYSTSVAVGDTASAVATALIAVVAADPSRVVDLTYVTDNMTFTNRNLGIAVGDMDIRVNYYDSDELPAGLVLGTDTFTAGTVDPDISDALDNIGDTWFNVLVAPYSDETNLEKVEIYLASQADPLVQKPGMYYTAKKDTRANLITFATNASRNSQYVSLIAATNQPDSINGVSAAVASRVAESVQDDPAVPLHRMTLTGVLPVVEQDRWTLIERNQLVENGITTLTQNNGVQTEGMVTMYLKNSAGAEDTALRYQNTLFILFRLQYTFVQRILSKYGRAKLADNSDRMSAGQVVMTPETGRAEAIAWFIEQEAAGQVENLDQFKDELVVSRPSNNPNRMDWLLPPDLVNQFIIGSAVIQFRLQSTN
tara:strand:- start:11292 stop:12758 length:1467 start_codon:yes stop_codon:yes gene_type:complete